MRLWQRAEKAPSLVLEAAALPAGEKVLAFASDGVRWLLGTARALYVVTPGEGTRRLPWETIQAADWDQEAEILALSEVGTYGAPRAEFTFELEAPALLLQLVRERVTASVVLQRGYLIGPSAGFKVIGRRSPAGGEIAWMLEYDAGIDPEDPEVRAAADEALVRARADVGE